jgi:hypothetical protein
LCRKIDSWMKRVKWSNLGSNVIFALERKNEGLSGPAIFLFRPAISLGLCGRPQQDITCKKKGVSRPRRLAHTARSFWLCFWPRTVRLPRFTQPLATVPYTPRQSSHPPRAKADDRIDASRSCCPQLSRPGDKRLVQWYLQLARRAERRWWPRAGRDVPALGSGGPRHLHMRCGVCSSRTMKASRRAEQEGNSDTPMTPTGGRPAIGLQVRHEGCYCAACAPGAEAAATMATCEYSDRFGVGGRREWVESS